MIQRDFATYSGEWLERLFQEHLAASGKYNVIGNYWESGNKNEIDIVVLNELNKTAVLAEYSVLWSCWSAWALCPIPTLITYRKLANANWINCELLYHQQFGDVSAR